VLGEATGLRNIIVFVAGRGGILDALEGGQQVLEVVVVLKVSCCLS